MISLVCENRLIKKNNFEILNNMSIIKTNIYVYTEIFKISSVDKDLRGANSIKQVMVVGYLLFR